MTDAQTTGEGKASEPERIGERIERSIDRLVGGLSAETVFGKPERIGDRLIITAASVQRGGGFGFGSGAGRDPNGETGGGGGGGGGGSSEGRPVAVIEVGPEGVRVQPVFDFTRLGLTGIAALLTVLRGGRRRRR